MFRPDKKAGEEMRRETVVRDLDTSFFKSNPFLVKRGKVVDGCLFPNSQHVLHIYIFTHPGLMACIIRFAAVTKQEEYHIIQLLRKSFH